MEAVRGAVQDIQSRKNSGGGGREQWFSLKDGQTAVVRFLEQDDEVKWAWVHDVEEPGKQYPRKVPCRDQDENGQRNGEPCPGCEKGLKRKFMGTINLIRRDAPKIKVNEKGDWVRDSANNLVFEGTEDQLAVWTSGITVFDELQGKDVTYRGLRSRDFRVSRRGTGLDTKYTIEPADPDAGPQPLSEADKALEAAKPDLTEKVTPPPYDNWWDEQSPSNQEAAPEVSEAVSPFLRRS